MTSPIDIQGSGVFSPKLRSASLVRKQIGQNSEGYLGVDIRTASGPVDPDPGTLKLRVFRKNDYGTYPATNELGELVVEVEAADLEREKQGLFFYLLSPEITHVTGNLSALWSWKVDGKQASFLDHVMVLEQMPFYDSLRENEKLVVEQVTWMFGDLFDSTEGGANLTENFQTHFTYERIAHLMAVAVNRMNVMAAPITSWGVGHGNGSEVPQGISGVLLMGTYLEVLKHLMRSYVEQPEFRNMQVTYTDRRDYPARWKMIYDDEKRDFDQMLKIVKRKFLTLGRGSLLVAGGIYGGSGVAIPGLYSAQVRSMRFAPAAGAISWGNSHMTSPGPWQ